MDLQGYFILRYSDSPGPCIGHRWWHLLRFCIGRHHDIYRTVVDVRVLSSKFGVTIWEPDHFVRSGGFSRISWVSKNRRKIYLLTDFIALSAPQYAVDVSHWTPPSASEIGGRCRGSWSRFYRSHVRAPCSLLWGTTINCSQQDFWWLQARHPWRQGLDFHAHELCSELGVEFRQFLSHVSLPRLPVCSGYDAQQIYFLDWLKLLVTTRLIPFWWLREYDNAHLGPSFHWSLYRPPWVFASICCIINAWNCGK